MDILFAHIRRLSAVFMRRTGRTCVPSKSAQPIDSNKACPASEGVRALGQKEGPCRGLQGKAIVIMRISANLLGISRLGAARPSRWISSHKSDLAENAFGLAGGLSASAEAGAITDYTILSAPALIWTYLIDCFRIGVSSRRPERRDVSTLVLPRHTGGTGSS